MENLDLYNSAKNYFEGPDNMKNEVAMWFVAGGLLLQKLSEKIGNLPFGGLKEKIGYQERKKLKDVDLLDFCSGPGNFVNHLSFIIPEINAVCVDRNVNFVRDGNKLFANWKFIEGDATKISLGKKFSFVTASSAYHHIEDDFKVDFLKNIHNHLSDNGVAIMCENFLPDYHSDSQKNEAINKYYDELENWYEQGNTTDKAVQVIKKVRQQELGRDEEHKVAFRIFENHVKKSGLRIDTDISVWQPKSFVVENAGSHVIVLTKR